MCGGFDQQGTFDSFNDFMRVNKFDVANSQKMFVSSVKHVH